MGRRGYFGGLSDRLGVFARELVGEACGRPGVRVEGRRWQVSDEVVMESAVTRAEPILVFDMSP